MTDQPIPRSERMSRPASRARSRDNISGPPHSAHDNPFAADSFGGYSTTSIVLHWLMALAMGVLIIAIAVGALELHVLLGLLASPVLLAYAVRRLLRGFARAPDEPVWLALVARLSMIALLLSIVALAISGIALPAVDTGAYALPGITFPDPAWPGDPVWAGRLEAIHATAAVVLFAALALHLVLVLSYSVRGLTSIALRMRHPVDGGR